jgi:hypothetical protein
MDKKLAKMDKLCLSDHYTKLNSSQLQPLVPPQVLHFMQVPLRTSV